MDKHFARTDMLPPLPPPLTETPLSVEIDSDPLGASWVRTPSAVEVLKTVPSENCGARPALPGVTVSVGVAVSVAPMKIPWVRRSPVAISDAWGR